MQAETLPLNSLSPRRLVHLGLFLVVIALVMLWNVAELQLGLASVIFSLVMLISGVALVDINLPRFSFFKRGAVLAGVLLCAVIMGAVFLTSAATALTLRVEQSQVIPGEYKAQALQILFDQTWDIALGAEPKTKIRLPESVSVDMKNVTVVALTGAAQGALTVGSIIATICLVLALTIYPEKKLETFEDSVLAEVRQITVEQVAKIQDELLAIDQELTSQWPASIEPEPQTA